MEVYVGTVPPTHLWVVSKKQGDITVRVGCYTAKRVLLNDTKLMNKTAIWY